MTFSTKAERYAYKCGIDKGYANACLDAVNALKESERVNELLKHNSELLERARLYDNERRRLARIIDTIDPARGHSIDQLQGAAAAMRMIGDAIGELFGSIASLESEEATLLRGPEHHHRAEAIIEALQRIRVRSRFTYRAKLGDYITQGERLSEGDAWEPLGEAINKAMPELVVTKDGVPFEDQAEGLRKFKEACKPHPVPIEQADTPGVDEWPKEDDVCPDCQGSGWAGHGQGGDTCGRCSGTGIKGVRCSECGDTGLVEWVPPIAHEMGYDDVGRMMPCPNCCGPKS